MADKVTKICMDIYRKLEKSRVLKLIEGLQISDTLEICYLYDLLWKYVKKYISIQASIFTSPELKAHVSFSDRLLSIVCLSVWRLSVRLLHFQLLLQNRWANFNQSWHKSSLGKEDSELYKWRTTPFPKGR
jgi:hypothetical protein